MIVQHLQGWNVAVERGQEVKQGSDGMPESVAETWTLVFQEVLPPTNNRIVFTMNEETKDTLIRMLQSGILTALEIPKM